MRLRLDKDQSLMKKTIKVGKSVNSAIINVRRQTHVTIHDAKGNLVFSDKSITGKVNPLLAPGYYLVETDGIFKSIKLSKRVVGVDLE